MLFRSSESEVEAERAQHAAPAVALAELRGMTPEALEALRGRGLDSPDAIVGAGRQRLGEVLTNPEQADEVFAAAQEWTVARASATEPPSAEVAAAGETAPAPQTESA